MSLNPKVATYIGFSIKSGKILYGYEKVIAARSVRLILCDPALSENSSKKVQSFAERKKIHVIVVENLAEFRHQRCAERLHTEVFDNLIVGLFELFELVLVTDVSRSGFLSDFDEGVGGTVDG